MRILTSRDDSTVHAFFGMRQTVIEALEQFIVLTMPILNRFYPILVDDFPIRVDAFFREQESR